MRTGPISPTRGPLPPARGGPPDANVTFATYADYREEWAIEGDSLEEARRRIGTDPEGAWLGHALWLGAEPVECRDAFVTADDDATPAVEEITPDMPWAYRAAHREWLERSRCENIAAVAAEFHTHAHYGDFYDAFGERTGGFTGMFDLCIAMADALTEWEIANGLAQAYENAGISWIEIVADFVDSVIESSLENGIPAHPAAVLRAIQVLQSRTAS